MSEPSPAAPPAVPDLGIGVGLRVPHYAYIREHRPKVDFFEIISENFMIEGGKPLVNLDHVTAHYPVVAHGVSLNIGGPSDPDAGYLKRLKALVRRTRAAWASDHLCWTGTGEHQLHDLLPLPYTQAIAKRVAERARRVQDTLGVRFALENTSSYMTYRQSEMNEWQFLGEVAERADIGILLDVNNIYVSAYNHGFDAYEYLRGIPHERVVQMHLAGHTNLGKLIIDTHNGDVIEPVWELYRAAIELCGPISTLLEWDDEIPEFSKLAALSDRARSVREQALSTRQNLEHNPYEPSFVRGKALRPRPEFGQSRAQHTAGHTAELDAWTELQHALVKDLQQPRALHKSDAIVARAERELTGNARVSPVEQLEVYREQFWLRHTSALLEDFPGVSGILGQRHWEPLVEGYLQAHPPDSWTLRDLGCRFSDYIATQTGLPEHALCVDMARLEWLYTEVFDAADSGRLDPEKLASIADDAWDHVRVRFNPCVRLLHVGYPVARLRKQLRARLDERLGERAAEPEAVVIPARAEQHLVLYRDAADGLCFSAVEAAAAALIEALQSGKPLRNACETVAERLPGSASTLESSLGSWFGSWGAKGWIVDVVCDPIIESNQ